MAEPVSHPSQGLQETDEGRLPPSRGLEVGSAAAALVVAALLTLFAGAIELRNETGGIDPRWWPRLLGLTGLAASIALLAVALTRRVSRGDLEAIVREGRLRIGVTLAATVAYLLAWPALGFLVCTPVLIVVLLLGFGVRRWPTLLFFPAGITAFVYLLFHVLLKVPL